MRKNLLKSLFVCAILVSSFTASAGGKNAYQNHQSITVNKGARVGKRVHEKPNHPYDISNTIIEDLKLLADGNMIPEDLEVIKTNLVLYYIDHNPCASMKKWITARQGLTIIENEMSTFVETYNHIDFATVAHEFDRTKAHMKTACRQLINR